MMHRLLSFLLLATFVAAPSAAAPGAPPPPATSQWLGVFTVARPELLDPSRWSPADEQAVSDHFQYWKKLTGEGVVIVMGRTQDVDANGRMPVDGMGITVFEAVDRAVAERIFLADPAIARGVFKGRLHSYKVALAR